jgi:hypothetical protein
MKTERIHMMRQIVIALGVTILFSCTTAITTGQTVKESRELPAFDVISLAMSGDIFIRQGDKQSVEIEASKDVLDIIETKIKGDALVVKTQDGHWRNLGQVRVYITVPTIHGLNVSGSGEMVCQTPIHSNDIKIEVSGSGNITISDLKAPVISTSITGSGNINLGGSNEQANLDAVITGSGSFKAEDLNVANAHVTITGSGSARVSALKQLETNITGSGSVHYKGNPIINASSTGSGKTVSL